MKIEFCYPGYEAIAPLEIPDASLMGVFSPNALPQVDEADVIEQGFAHPIGDFRLREAARGKRSALILIDDATRATPTARLLPRVLDELDFAGVRPDYIEFLQATGTRRPMTDDELKTALGPSVGRFKVHEHHWKNAEEQHHFGQTLDGTPVVANQLLKRFDFILGIGSIVPDRVHGFSGGADQVFPGVSGPAMIDRNQWEASMRRPETIMGAAENSMRLRTEEAARRTKLSYIVNVVQDAGADGKIIGCFTGDLLSAHRAGCGLAREVYAVALPARADIVLIDSHPADRDLWQSAKAICAGAMAVKTGGTIVCVAPNPEGVAANHETLLQTGYIPHARLVEHVQQGRHDDLVGLAVLADICQVIDRANCILASPGVSEAEARKLGFRFARTPQDGLDLALARQGRQATIAVIRQGGQAMPVVHTNAGGRGD